MTAAVPAIRAAVGAVVDPEIPALSIDDLGILRDIRIEDDRVTVVITPTYSGCPAMDAIRQDIAAALRSAGVERFEIETVLTPPWTTDWMSAEARERLRADGIAPPIAGTVVACPHCGSATTEVVSRFGSTSCKALLVCSACGEPFHHFKEH